CSLREKKEESMNHPLRPRLRQAGIVGLLLTTAIGSGILLGWLLSTDLTGRVVQSRRSSGASPSAIARTTPSPTPAAPLAIVRTPTLRPPPSRPAVATDEPASTTVITATAEPATALFQQIVAAEAGLRSGELEAVIDYGNGSRSSAQVRFDLGTAQILPRLDFKTAYQSASSTQTIEEITIGDRTWERHDEQSWNSVPARKGMWDQIRFFLPGAQYGSDPSYSQQQDRALLRWYDATRDADVTLTVDRETSTPLLLERHTRSTGLTLTVTYPGWNTPIEILPPVDGIQ
ncbi:MAG TPA: hypothetical protein VGD58_31510, partial [Herpetosiphonaceae bacterium]